MKIKLNKTLVIIVVTLSSFFVTNTFLNWANSPERQLMDAVQKIDQVTPIKVDEETRLDSIDLLENKTVQYSYTLVNISQEDVDIVKFKDVMTTQIVDNVKNNPDLRAFRSFEVTFKYTYADKSSVYLFEVIVEPKDYQPNIEGI